MTDRERVDRAMRETGFWRPGLAEAFVGLLRSVREECAQVAERYAEEPSTRIEEARGAFDVAEAIRESGEG